MLFQVIIIGQYLPVPVVLSSHRVIEYGVNAPWTLCIGYIMSFGDRSSTFGFLAPSLLLIVRFQFWFHNWILAGGICHGARTWSSYFFFTKNGNNHKDLSLVTLGYGTWLHHTCSFCVAMSPWSVRCPSSLRWCKP